MTFAPLVFEAHGDGWNQGALRIFSASSKHQAAAAEFCREAASLRVAQRIFTATSAFMAWLAVKDRHTGDWSVQRRRKYFRWAGHVSRRQDNRWAITLLDWQPAAHLAQLQRGCYRRPGRPRLRWEDEVMKFAEDWRNVAQDREAWQVFEHVFCNAF